jgi:hypothetical protein
MVEQTYHEMLSTVINELLRPLLADSARASPQTAPSGSAHVQETQPIMKKDILTTTEFNDIFHLN